MWNFEDQKIQILTHFDHNIVFCVLFPEGLSQQRWGGKSSEKLNEKSFIMFRLLENWYFDRSNI